MHSGFIFSFGSRGRHSQAKTEEKDQGHTR
jgi:hypothetical protein